MAGDKETSASKNDSISPDSPFYVHPSDYPRQMHVSEALTDTNYADWCQEMINFLLAKNKTGFIDGTIQKPEQSAAELMSWMRCDAMIKGWINTAMEKEIRSSVKYAQTAEEMWRDLKERFGKLSAPRAYELKQKLTATRQNGASVSTYYTQLRVLWDKLMAVLPSPKCSCNGCSCGMGKTYVDLRDKEKLYEFLLGLDVEFATIRTQILAMDPMPSLSGAYHLVSEDEQQRNISAGKRNTIETAAFQAAWKQNQTQSKSGGKDPKHNVTDLAEKCSVCGREGHSQQGCFKVIGYPDWWPGKGAKRDVKTKPKAAHVEGDSSPVPGINNDQYRQFVSFFSEKEKPPIANMAVMQPATNSSGIDLEELDWVG